MPLRIFRQSAIPALLLITLLSILHLYDTALRPPRTLDGWALFAGVGFQLLYGWRKAYAGLPLGPVSIWMQVHIHSGYMVVVLFAIHTQLSLPDTGLEWALWILFVLLALSGMTGAVLTRMIPTRLASRRNLIAFEKIRPAQAGIARQVDQLVSDVVSSSGSTAIADLYTGHLHHFFHQPRNLSAHLRKSKLPLKAVRDALDSVADKANPSEQEALRSIRSLAAEKDDLDFQYAHQGLLTGWLFVHVPATYGLVILSLFHVAIVHAFSSGV